MDPTHCLWSTRPGRKHIDCRTQQADTHAPACYLLCGVDIPPIWHLRGGGGVETGKGKQSRPPPMRSCSNSRHRLSRRRQSPASVITHTHSSLLIFASRRAPSREHILPPNFFVLEPGYITSNADVFSEMKICCGWRILLLSCSLCLLSDSNSSPLLLVLDASSTQDQMQRGQNYVFPCSHQFLCVWQRQLARSLTQMVSELSCSKYCSLKRGTGMNVYHSHVLVTQALARTFQLCHIWSCTCTFAIIQIQPGSINQTSYIKCNTVTGTDWQLFNNY